MADIVDEVIERYGDHAKAPTPSPQNPAQPRNRCPPSRGDASTSVPRCAAKSRRPRRRSSSATMAPRCSPWAESTGCTATPASARAWRPRSRRRRNSRPAATSYGSTSRTRTEHARRALPRHPRRGRQGHRRVLALLRSGRPVRRRRGRRDRARRRRVRRDARRRRLTRRSVRARRYRREQGCGRGAMGAPRRAPARRRRASRARARPLDEGGRQPAVPVRLEAQARRDYGPGIPTRSTAAAHPRARRRAHPQVREGPPRPLPAPARSSPPST